MAMGSHLPHLFTPATCQSYIHRVRWNARPLSWPQGPSQDGRQKGMGAHAPGRGTPREPGRGHDDQDWPALSAWSRRQGGGVLHATPACTVKTVQKAADLAVSAGSRRSPDAARSSRAVPGYGHACVHQTKKA